MLKKTLLALLAVGTFAFGFTACEKKGPMEKAGKTIDDAGRKVGEAIEEAGDKIEDATDKAR